MATDEIQRYENPFNTPGIKYSIQKIIPLKTEVLLNI